MNDVMSSVNKQTVEMGIVDHFLPLTLWECSGEQRRYIAVEHTLL